MRWFEVPLADVEPVSVDSDVLPEGLHWDGEFTIRDAQDHPWVSIHEPGIGDPEIWRQTIIARIAQALWGEDPDA